METAKPRDVGMDPERIEHFYQTVERKIAEKWLRGGTFLIARKGRIVANRAVGVVDAATNRAARTDDVYCVFSTTKPLTSTMLLMKVERGDVRLVDKVADYIPEFAQAGKHGVTVFHALTHTGGFPTMPLDWPLERWGDWDATIARLSAMPLEFEPGTACHYHALTQSWIQAEIARRVDGGKRSFAEMCAEDLYRPLGMKDSHMCVRADLKARRVPIQALDAESIPFPLPFLEAFNDLPDAVIPGGGSHATAADLARFYQMHLNGGSFDGRRFLSPAMVELATTIHTGALEDRLFEVIRVMNGWERFPANRGLGFWVRGHGVFPSYFGSLASPRTFGHAGASSIMAWADPARDLVFVGLTSGLIAEHRSILRWNLFSDLAEACVAE